jgi:RHS repeat-associated protein
LYGGLSRNHELLPQKVNKYPSHEYHTKEQSSLKLPMISPYINQFISADSIVPNPTNPQNLNRYSYVINNPLRYTDPTGHFCVEEDGDGNIIHVDCGSGMPPSTQNPPDEEDDDEVDLEDLDPSDDTGSPLVSLAGVLLLVDLGLLDVTLALGIITAPSAGPLGLTAEIVLIPLEILSVDLTVYAAQMAATGSTDHDPLLLIHGFVPDFLPYEP